jgi:diguanylate cyclase (GGDEF)-like protein
MLSTRFWNDPHARLRRKQTSARLLLAASLVVLTGFCAVCVSVLWEMRRTDWEQARTNAKNLVGTLEADIARNLQLYDLSLQAVVDGLKEPDLAHVSDRIRRLVLFDRSATAKYLGSIRVVDVSGKVSMDSRNLDVPPDNLSGSAPFRFHREHDSDTLFVSGLIVSAGREPRITVSRRISASDGSFAGMVIGTLQVGYFGDLFARVKLPSGSAVVLVHADGSVIARMPERPDDVGRDFSQNEIFRREWAAPAGDFETEGVVDRIQRLYVFSHVSSYPLLVSVNTAIDDIYADWRKEASRIGLLVLVLALSLATIGLTTFWAREWRRRSERQTELATLATTDPLTGLCNRRRFDEVVAAEWSKPDCGGKSVALLLIDADHFKSFNDTFGHQAGDFILRRISQAIVDCTDPATDLAARYGGDEFAVFLRGTSQQRAYSVSETIRTSVRRLTGPAAAAGANSATLSIGLACIRPEPSSSPRELFTAADTALYEAKRRGRNQTHCQASMAPAAPPFGSAPDQAPSERRVA